MQLGYKKEKGNGMEKLLEEGGGSEARQTPSQGTTSSARAALRSW